MFDDDKNLQKVLRKSRRDIYNFLKDNSDFYSLDSVTITVSFVRSELEVYKSSESCFLKRMLRKFIF